MHLGHGGQIELFAKTYGHKPSHILDFSTNTNPWFPHEILRRWLNESTEAMFRYPDSTSGRLKEALAGWHGVAPENIFPANGSTEVLYLLAGAFRGETALIFSPSFSEYEAAARTENMDIHFVQAYERDGFIWDQSDSIREVDRIRPRVVFIGNPNNPSGRLVPRGWMEALQQACEWNGSLLVLDEAFMNFVPGESAHSLLSKSIRSSNLLVMRSLTKFFSIPGIRLGYAVGHSRWIQALMSRQPTWSVNGLAQKVALRLLEIDTGDSVLGTLAETRASFFAALQAVPGLKPYPSDVNFILCRLNPHVFDPQRILTYLGRKGILVRSCIDFRGLESGEFIRIAVRREEENNILVESLSEVLCHGR